MRYLMLICCAGLLFGQGTETKPKPEAYEFHQQTHGGEVAAEFMVHSFSRDQQVFIAENYLVVEVAVFPPKGEMVVARLGDFSLRINGKKQTLQPQMPAAVAASLQNPNLDQAQQTGISGEAGVGNTGVIFGGPQRNPSSYPGGNNPPGRQLPPRVPVPQDNPGGIKRHPVKAEDLLLETALVEGEHQGAFSGFLYFPFKGKINTIKTLDLLYQDVELRIR